MEIANLTDFPAEDTDQKVQPSRRKSLKVEDPVTASESSDDKVEISDKSRALLISEKLKPSLAVTYEEMQYLKSTLSIRG